MQPGVLGGQVNQALRPYGAKIGPDPASLAACALGGILSNNASGKCCGVTQNAYHTLDALTFVLPSGTVAPIEQLQSMMMLIAIATRRCSSRTSSETGSRSSTGLLR